MQNNLSYIIKRVKHNKSFDTILTDSYLENMHLIISPLHVVYEIKLLIIVKIDYLLRNILDFSSHNIKVILLI